MTVQEILAAAISAQGAAPFRAALIRQVEMHDDYARATSNAHARQGAEASRAACLRAYDHAGYGAIGDIRADIGALVVSINVACKLLGISPAARTKAIVDWEETQGAR